jgi:hypothetical protein
MNEQEKIKELEAKVKVYEQNGAAKFFYSLNRKLNEMADLLNKSNLSNMDLDDKESKTFDRLFKILEKSKVVSDAAVAVQNFAGITNDEEKDTNNPKYRITTSESIANVLGNSAGQNH